MAALNRLSELMSFARFQEWDEKAKKAKEKYQKDLAAYNAQKKEDGGTPKKSKTVSDSFSKKSPKPQKQSTSSPSKFKSKEFIESSEDDSSDEEVRSFYSY